MALVLADRVRDTTTTTGTGTVTLSGTAPTGYQTFGAAIGNGNTTYYTINAGSQWEVGLGTYSSTGPSLARTTVLASSNGGSLVNFSTGTKDVFVTYPAEEAVYQDGSAIKAGTAILGVTNGGTGVTTSTGTGSVVLSNSPTFVTPTLGAASATSIANALGAVGTPSYTFTGDTNTGIFSPAADTIAFVEGGVEAMRINSSGLVGIGTSSPQVGVHVSFADQSTNRIRLQNTGSGGGNFDIIGGLAGVSNAGLSFFDVTNSATRMVIDSSGSVGIGTSSPGSKLDVRGVITGGDGTIQTVISYLASAGVTGTLTNHPYVFYANNAERARIATDGTMTLSIGGVSNTHQFNYNESGGEIQLIDSTGAGPILIDNVSGLARFYKVGSGAVSMGTTGANYFQFITNGSERMRIDLNGLVGIGTSAPASLLHVKRGSNATEVYPSGTWASRIINATDGSGENGLVVGNRWAATTSTVFEAGSIYGGGTGSWFSYYKIDGVGNSIWSSNGSERARISTDGYLLVGTTTPLAANTSNEFKNTGAGSWPLTLNSNDRGLLIRNSASGSGFYAYFEYNSTLNGGSISWSGGTTAYNTTSDYRLKKIDGPITNSGAYIDALNPVQGHWRSDGARFIGLVAHEVQEVSETAVVIGEKDGELMQQMDYSSPEIIANLIAELQSLRARVAQLEGN